MTPVHDMPRGCQPGWLHPAMSRNTQFSVDCPLETGCRPVLLTIDSVKQ
jgi:hypothetical protein